jgi:hypothetical protein
MLTNVWKLIHDLPALFRAPAEPNHSHDGSSEPMPADRQYERRQHDRQDTDLNVSLRHDGKRFDAQLLDASIGGALLKCAEKLPSGAIIELHLPTISVPVSAQVMRVEEDNIGVQYTEAGIGVLVTGWAVGRSSVRPRTEDDEAGEQVTGG